MKRESAINIISFLLALLFSYAAISKLLDIQKFQVQLGQSTMLGFIATPVSYIVPSIEIALAVLLFGPTSRLFSYYASFSLMAIFTTYIIIIMNYSYHIPCSCGGLLQKLTWRQHLVFNGFFILLILLGILNLESQKENDKTEFSKMS